MTNNVLQERRRRRRSVLRPVKDPDERIQPESPHMYVARRVGVFVVRSKNGVLRVGQENEEK